MDWIHPLQVTTAVVAVLSGFLTVIAWTVFRRPAVRWLAALGGPFVVAACVYWLPVLSGEPSPEYAHWAVIFIGIWGVAGVGVSCLVALVWTLAKTRRHR
jgi:hypothetical protein